MRPALFMYGPRHRHVRDPNNCLTCEQCRESLGWSLVLSNSATVVNPQCSMHFYRQCASLRLISVGLHACEIKHAAILQHMFTIGALCLGRLFAPLRVLTLKLIRQ
jgi:hypothetical protein